LFLTDSGLETDLIYNHGIDLPHFAAFTLTGAADGRAVLAAYYRRHVEIARTAGTGFILEAPTWRASADWSERLGIDSNGLDAHIEQSVTMLRQLRAEYESDALPTLISGCIGPRGDGYVASAVTSADAAQAYHAAQIASLVAAGVDMLTALTMTTVEEAIGILRAARPYALPVVISFTLETDGRLPSGATLGEAIAATDSATDGQAAYFMVNCAHPSHFEPAIDDGAPWLQRLRGLRANASRCSHAELDAMTTLDAGDPAALAAEYALLRQRLPQLTVLGGCCGTDARHIAAIAATCTSDCERA
jgi:S-methylmethionine-dependent homocysteine/selenocysteine methylase